MNKFLDETSVIGVPKTQFEGVDSDQMVGQMMEAVENPSAVIPGYGRNHRSTSYYGSDNNGRMVNVVVNNETGFITTSYPDVDAPSKIEKAMHDNRGKRVNKFFDRIKNSFRKSTSSVTKVRPEYLFETWWDTYGRHDGLKYTKEELAEGINTFERENPPGMYIITDLYYKYGIAHFLAGEDVGDFNNFYLTFYVDYDMSLWIMAHIMVDRSIEIDYDDFLFIKQEIKRSPYQRGKDTVEEGDVDITKLIVKKFE